MVKHRKENRQRSSSNFTANVSKATRSQSGTLTLSSTPAATSAATPPKPTGALDQQRAVYAWEAVTQAHNSEGLNFSDYTNLTKAAPALIMNNGLMQALAFYQDKGKCHHLTLAKQLRQWLHQHLGLADGTDFQPVMEALLHSDPRRYRLATQETLQLLRWLRQFAAARKRAQAGVEAKEETV